MHRFFLSICTLLIALCLLGATLGGCGGGSGGDTVTVQTGTLSKAEFIKRADSICEAARAKFNREFVAFLKANKSTLSSSKASQEDSLAQIVETTLLPNYERVVTKIGALGAPKADEREVALFLNALNDRLGELEENPNEASAAANPFPKAEKHARAYGLNGCAESFH